MRALLVTLCITLSAPWAFSAEYSRRVWRTEDGLPQSKIQAFAQTPDGYLWIGTSGGLVRFDGARFTVFDRSNTPALRDDSILSLLTARDGTLWIGTEGGGMAHMRGSSFDAFGSSQGLANGFVRAFLEDSRGRFWVGTDRGFFRFEKGRFLRLDGAGQAPILAAYSIVEDHLHTIWVGTSLGLFHMEGDRMVQGADGTADLGVITAIHEAAPGELWLASAGGLSRWVHGRLLPDARLSSINARRILRDHTGNLWVGAVSGGLFSFPPGATRGTQVPGPLPDNTVLAIFEDTQRSLWIGTQDGLLRLTETTVRTFNSRDGLAEDNVATVYADPRGPIWFGTISALLYRLEGDRVVRFRAPSADPQFPGRNIYVSRDGTEWIGSTTRGFLRIGAGGARLFTMADGLRSNGIRGFLEDRAGVMWIATGSGLSRWDGKSIRTYYVEDGLAYGGVRALAEDAGGDIIVGTDGGVNRVHQSRFVRDSVFEKLGNQRVWAILPDPGGVLWLGTRGNGLIRIESGRARRYTTADGLPSNSIYQILDDRAGRLWMSSAAGVFSVQRRQLDALAHGKEGALAVVPYDTDDGMLSSQMNGGAESAGSRDGSGNLWFPSVKGAVRLDPRQLRALPASPARIESLTADGRPVAIDAPPGSPISIPPGANRVEIDFTSPNLAAPDRVSFRYMLEGFDAQWLPSLKRRSAFYTNLPPRKYRFRIVAQDVAQPDRTSEASLDFELQPHFYETAWFYAAIAGTLGLLVFAILRLYARQTRARYALVLAERTRLAREMHDTVIQGCVGVSTLLEAVRSMPPAAEMRATLVDRAASQIRLTVNEAREAVWDLRHSTIEHSFTETFQDFVRQVSTSGDIEIETAVEGTPAQLSESAGRNLLLVAREAVRNAVAHGAPTRIGVKLHFEVSEVRLEVEDNGRGFRTDQARAAGHYGIVGMRERVEQSGGAFDLRSAPGAGTSIVVRVPLKKHSPRKHARA